ncbi:MAG TPA: hypothetical protein VMH04_24140 [Candidatus Solibacter sp.]|nr:hypothetical protein [Candidatus Solibacter sp.]
MRTLILFCLLTTAATAQQLFTQETHTLPREAESILMASCRAVGEQFAIPMPNPKVELRLDQQADSVETDRNTHIIRMRRWNRALFKKAAVFACIQSAESDVVPILMRKVRDY